MSLPLRITIHQKDYTYKVLTRHITRDTKLIKIDLEGTEYELHRLADNQWHSDVTISDNQELLAAIARNLSLRYRIY
jgi:hypothetical protein